MSAAVPTSVARERGIIFSGESVRAILDDRKTVTRRLKKTAECRQGAVGDRLWVRETIWLRRIATDHREHRWGESRVHDVRYVVDHPEKPWFDCTPDEEFVKRSPIYMPRFASRLTLEIASLRIERLHDITPADVAAEGVQVGSRQPCTVNGEPGHVAIFDPVHAFSFGWDVLNGKRAPWSSNPWVFRIEFRRIP